jgi:hypothetical protein
MWSRGRTVERAAAQIAGCAHGVVTRRELLDAGVTVAEVDWRVRTGALIPEYRGVYRVGHAAPSVSAAYIAAVKACGDGALLSGLAAAYLWGLTKGPPPPPQVTSQTERRIKGIETRRARRIDPRDRAAHKHIPVTTVARTVVDIAPLLSLDDLARACHEAEIKHGTKPADIEAVLERRPTSPAAAKLRRCTSGETHVTLSELEKRFLQLLRDNDLPLPHTNRRAGTKRVDGRWPDHHLTVELDSFRYHNSRHSWEQDRIRERQAHARGDNFRRYTYTDVLQHPEPMLKELRTLLDGD